jgi:putative endonuclease
VNSIDPQPGTTAFIEVGRRGEALAAAYLESAGMRIVAANFVVPVGRSRTDALIYTEIDLVAYDGETLCFVEVKSRLSDWFAPPEVNVDRRKQRQIARAARAYRRMFGLEGGRYRYDVITVVFPSEPPPNAGPNVNLLRNYWTDDQLRKQKWSEHYYD